MALTKIVHNTLPTAGQCRARSLAARACSTDTTADLGGSGWGVACMALTQTVYNILPTTGQCLARGSMS